MRHRVPSHFNWTLPRCSTTTGVDTRGNRRNRVVCFTLWRGFTLRGKLNGSHRQSERLFSLLWGTTRSNIAYSFQINPLNPELNPICYLLALLAHHFLHVSRIMVKSLTLRLLMSYIHMERIFLMFLDHTQRRTTVGRTPLDE